ncbi:MAG: right handed beta helix region family protein [Actinomycetia bacterium]|nr:right handed beta helix region family protein [Actinomycetes bacterium]
MVGTALAVLFVAGLAACTNGTDPKPLADRVSLGLPKGAGMPQSSTPPTKGTPVCGQPILISPYRYDGKAGKFTRADAPAGLPAFGAKGTAFPADTAVVVIPPGDNTIPGQTAAYAVKNTIYYFEPGTHLITQGMYTGTNAVYIGGYTTAKGKAILTGVRGGSKNGLGAKSLSLSEQANAYQTWEYLTIKDYGASHQSAVLGIADHGGTTDVGNTYKYDTIGPNEYGYQGDDAPPSYGKSSGGGYAINLLSDTTIEYNCLTHDAQGAFNGSGVNINISHNEISWNGLGSYPDDGGSGGSPYGCGCSGGGKLFFSLNPVLVGNYVHDNYNTGIWLDFDNDGATVTGNYISANWGVGITYEASYNADISDNTLVGNGWASDGAWPAGVNGGTCYGGVPCTNGYGPTTGKGGGNPYAAIYLPNSGGNPNLNAVTVPSSIRVPGCGVPCVIQSNYSGHLLVSGNVLINNFGGVKVYTDTNRYPGNIDNDSACSIPLGALDQSNSPLYYAQTRELVTGADAMISGSSVTSAGGTQTRCSNYGQSAAGETDGSQDSHLQAPVVGMAVSDQNTGKLLGTVTGVTSANSFTLSDSPGDRSGAELLLSSYGGCGPADYYGSRAGVTSGNPAALYWDNCLWGSRNVTVSGNSFTMQASRVTGCTSENMCGYMADEAFNAGVPTLMRVFDDYPSLIAKARGGLGNVWSRNAYNWTGHQTGGPARWGFWAGSQGNTVSYGSWRTSYGQDAGSTVSASGA